MLASAGVSRDAVVKPAAPGPPLTAHVQARVPPAVKPVTSTEQYWAARALTAETLLSVRSAHQQELRAMTQYGDEKRTVWLDFVEASIVLNVRVCLLARDSRNAVSK